MSVWRALAGRITVIADWLGDRISDVGLLLANLVRFTPARLARIAASLASGAVAAVRLPAGAVRAWRAGGARPLGRRLRLAGRNGGLWVARLFFQVLDLLGAPELVAIVWRVATGARALNSDELALAARILGPAMRRYGDVRVARGGILPLIYRLNGGRPFALFQTINLTCPAEDIFLHELVHVCQYERVGSRYIVEALLAQREEGYGYGGEEGLRVAWAQGRRLRDFNREQQAQILQDYYCRLCQDLDTSAHEPFIREFHMGSV